MRQRFTTLLAVGMGVVIVIAALIFALVQSAP